jgi:hypothetical protein
MPLLETEINYCETFRQSNDAADVPCSYPLLGPSLTNRSKQAMSGIGPEAEVDEQAFSGLAPCPQNEQAETRRAELAR